MKEADMDGVEETKGDQPEFNFNFDPSKFAFDAEAFQKKLSDMKAGGNDELLNFVSSKLGGLIGSDSGYLSTLPPPVLEKLEKLKALNQESQKIEKEFENEVRLLELKYPKKYKPLWEKRAEIISASPTIPEFWLTVLKNYHLFEESILPEDEPLLKQLLDISYDPIDDEPGSFRLHFTFAPNDYFTNTTLTKTYHISIEEGKAICDSIESSDIEWNEGKNITKDNPGKLGDETGSFFCFFYPPDVPEKDPPDWMLDLLEIDFAMAAALKDRIIHNAILWFTGDMDEMGDDVPESLLNFNEENYNEEDDDDFVPGNSEDEEPPECNQQ
eukprot:TRINITY_DN15967_c0_g1_i1.p1 TRINITY_DN15967_c0_g1~~TRINITY_DN15967_c0_g1_i1.p1  ORF type:complete len:328 (-),score=82.57 TRINITY_DN15967_c0_g1_i1:536-1519(-)